jgi:HEAT repeat protein
MVASSEFQSYLQEICCRYEKWWTKDALTEKIAAQQASFSFEQIVQTKEQKEERQEKPQIISLPIFKGIQDYIESEHILLVGSPGVGKSTALLRCLVSFAKAELEKPEPRIPVLIPLKRYKVPVAGSEDSSGMLTLIRDALKPQIRLRTPDVEDLLFDERLILLLDGLNEMPADSIRTHLKAFCEECKQLKIPLICTTRELGSGDLGIKRRLEIQPLSPLEINRFLKECMPSQEQKVLQLLSRDNRELSRTPFVLWMLYHVFRETGTVAETLGEAFREFFKSFKKLKEDAPVTDERRKDWNPWLEHLAFTMLKSLESNDPGLVISDERANKVMCERFGDIYGASSRIEELLKYHLLERVSEKEISFHHQLIQEYYAAECLLTKLPELIKKEPSQKYNQFQREHLNYLKWTEAIALMLGWPEITDEQAIKIVELALNVDLKLGARLAGAVRFKLQGRTINIIADFNISPQIKAELLGITSSEFAIPKLSAINETTDVELRKIAIKAFGNIISEHSFGVLRKALADKNDDIRKKAIISLAKLSSDQSIAEIAKLLDDSNTEIKRVAVYGLGTIADKRVILHLCKALYDSEAIICETAADALAKLGHKETISCLIDSLDFLNSKLSRNLSSLLKSTNPKLNDFKKNPLIFIKVINDPIGDARKSIIEALYIIEPKETVELLKKEQYELAPYGKFIEEASAEIGNPIQHFRL